MAVRRSELIGTHLLSYFSRTNECLYWTTMTDNLAVEWDWYFCQDQVDPKDRQTTGVCYLDRKAIILDSQLTRNMDDLYEVVYHELQHAAHDNYRGKLYKRFSEKDEHYAIYRNQYASAVMLRDMGWQLPNLPRGIVSFRGDGRKAA